MGTDASGVLKSVAKSLRGDLTFQPFFINAPETCPSVFHPFRAAEEYSRLGLNGSYAHWKISNLNHAGALSIHYPDEILVLETLAAEPALLKEISLCVAETHSLRHLSLTDRLRKC